MSKVDIVAKSWEKASSYEAYLNLVDQLVEDKKTTGENQSDAMVHYTYLGQVRMKRLNKTSKIAEEHIQKWSQINRPIQLLCITEAWCGDAAQVLPFVHQLTTLNKHLEMRTILRDENEELMSHFLTNGGKSIPVIIFYDPTNHKVLGHWGPRPSEMQKRVIERKKAVNPEPYQDFVIKAQKWYTKDKGKSIVNELSDTFWQVY